MKVSSRIKAGILIGVAVVCLWVFLSPKQPEVVQNAVRTGYFDDILADKTGQDDNFGFVPDLIQPHKRTIWDGIEDFKYSLSNLIFGEKEDMTPYWNNYEKWKQSADYKRFPSQRPLNTYSPQDQKIVLRKQADLKAKEANMSETDRLLRMTYSKIENMNSEMNDMRREVAQMRQTIEEQNEALDDRATEPICVTQYRQDMARIEQFDRDMDRIYQRYRSPYQQNQPDLSGFYWQRNFGTFQYVQGPF